MLKASLQIITSRIQERCMIMLINEELRVGFPIVSIKELMLMLFNEIDLFIGPKLCQLTSIWIKNWINKITWCHLNKLELHHRRSEIEHNLVIQVALAWIVDIPCTSFNLKWAISFKINIWLAASKLAMFMDKTFTSYFRHPKKLNTI